MSTESFTEAELEKQLMEKAASAAAMQWAEGADALLRSARDGKKTIAICGFSPTSRHLAPWDDERVEIWGVNEAHRHHSSYMKRWDRWFQIHKRWDFTKSTSNATKEHWEWLKEEHDFPIYMQEAWPDVPAAVKYPLHELLNKYPGVLELMPDGTYETRDYVTSSFAIMCLLAISEIEKERPPDWKLDDPPYGRIEIYGFDMATWTEFQYQKGSTEYWIGFARGRGIEVTVPYKCRLVSGKIYGYEVTRVYTIEMVRALIPDSEKKVAFWREQAEGIKAERNEAEAREDYEEGKRLFQMEVELARELNVEYGKLQELQDLTRYMEAGTTEDEQMVVNRQLLEFRVGSINKDRSKYIEQLNILRGRRSVIEEELRRIEKNGATPEEREDIEKRGKAAFQAEFDAAGMVNALYGREKIIEAFVRAIDNMEPDDAIVKAIMEADEIQKEEGK